jgi:hypothetical protein
VFASSEGSNVASIDLSEMQLVKIPDLWPPYDCNLHGAHCPALDNPPGPGPADLPGPADGGAAYVAELWRPAGATGLPGPADAAGLTGTARPGTAADTPASAVAATAWPRQFAQVMVEILAGVRPVRQVVPWATDHVLTQIRDLIPGFASDRRPRIRRVMTSQPAATAVEITVVAGFGPRTRALAMRFEQIAARQAAPGLPPRPARWLCTAIEAG